MLWRQYWICGVRKSGKWTHIYTIILDDPRNIQIDTKFIVIDILHVKLWAVMCLNSHFGGHLGFLKTLNGAIFASFRSWIYGSQRFRINQEQLCGLYFSLFQFSSRLQRGARENLGSLWHIDACICLCVHNKICCFSNMPRWIFMILGYNDHQVQVGGGLNNRGVQEFGVKGHLGVIFGNCSNMLMLLVYIIW